ncbi:MAG: 50S ribosomal protein L1 [Candidatus Aureabacteria bacterium]|nr:50S ribosomal protein L1 [Candidatus Auribacterota bacterium]
MKKKSKRYRKGLEKLEQGRVYALADAVALLKELPAAKFDETVDLAFVLGVDPKQNDQQVRGTVALPHGTGKKVRIAAFVKGAAVDEAKAAGADIIGGDELIKKVSEGWAEFDVAVTTPDLMKDMGRLGKMLGPRGLMPSPKTGTVTREIGRTIKELKAGRIEFRIDKSANVHVPIGKRSFAASALLENAQTIIEGLLRAKPQTSKGIYLKKCVLSSTMGAGIPVDMKEHAVAQG